MFIIRKKSSGNFWHEYNGDSKKVNISDFEVVLDSVAQTFSIQCKNGANIPIAPVPIAGGLKIIDETAGSAEFTFTNADDLRTKLVAISYTPYTGGSIPTLQTLAEILLNGGREVVINEDLDYDSVSANKSQALILAGDATADISFILDNDEFEVGDQIEFYNASSDGTNNYDVRIDNGGGLINPISETSFTVPFLSKCTLLKAQSSTWFITIMPYVSTGGGSYTDATFGAFVNGLTAKNTPIDADILNFTDSADSNKQKKVTWLNAWVNYIKVKADSVYTTASAVATQISTVLSSYSTTSQMNTALDLKADNSLFLIQQSDRTLTSNTSAQDIFDVGISGNEGRINLLANSTYHFEFEMSMANLSTTSGTISLSFDAGTANITLFKANVLASKAGLGNNSTVQHTFLESTSVAPIVNASTVANAKVFVSGILTCTTAGTFRPRVTMSVASASTVKSGTHIKMERLGSNTATHYPTS